MDPDQMMEVPAEETTPEETPEVAEQETTPEAEEAAPAEQPAEETTAPEPELFELPDGRKVDAAELSTLWKEEFMPEFTRRSQDLAALRQGQQHPSPAEDADPLKDPNYIPPTYDELAAQIETRILTGMADRQQKEAEARKAIEDTAITQLAAVKAADPDVNEPALFQYAMKHGFTDLTKAHSAMKERDDAVKAAMTHVKQNATERQDPVSARPGAAAGGALDPDSFGSSVAYLRALKAQGK